MSVDPRVERGIVLGIIALALAVFGIGQQVVAHHVHAAHVLIVEQFFEFAGGNVPPATAERFGDHAFFAALRRRAAHLFDGQFAVGISAQPVDAGDMFVFVKGHHAAATSDLIADRAFFHVMAGERHVVFLAKVIQLFGKVLQKQRAHAAPIPKTERFVSLLFREQKPQAVQHVLAVVLLEIALDHGRVSGVPPKVLRFVGEKSFDLLRKPFAVARFIRAVRAV